MLELFVTFLKIGFFTFGGGYAMIPIIEKELVINKKLVKSEEFLDYISVAQSFPGAIAVNLSLLLGYKLYKLKGAIICLIGIVSPSFISILILAYYYNLVKDSNVLNGFFYGVRPVIVSLLIYSFFNLSKKIEKNKFNIFFIALSFISVSFLNINPIFVILIGGFLGVWILSKV
ncbi:chromate transporter [Alkalithermobacter thermoalcaliphilus JW-YL-7 = DSM 7308]|uniref:Chromate transporter n=1 Tax=Alkalithermobacter thermoalcaliphilus JW-YL-7 = DSM 7308 TaxID=1121328 RepID=A0A150FRY7_CLOPD|nr:Chromate transporter [[Clostridium] paradoxum JW-YL-7 = DSM 7308]SHK36388.1 chromate transporter [[Clostridium] paradoxum JW-YL-7 = DSM 7308]